MKAIDVKTLKKLCEKEIKKGNGDKVIMISQDDEGNGFHYLWYAFCDPDEALVDDYLIDERIAKKENTIILG
jgi:hypothetical protein